MSGTEQKLEFSPEQREEIAKIRARYPENYPAAALLPVLHLAQKKFGYISDQVIDLVSRELGVPEADVREVVSFYTMFYTHKIGEYHIQVCHNIYCSIMGAESLIRHLEKKLNIKSGQTTPDGKFTLSRVECLGACDGAPMLQLNDKYVLNLTPEILDELLENPEALEEIYQKYPQTKSSRRGNWRVTGNGKGSEGGEGKSLEKSENSSEKVEKESSESSETSSGEASEAGDKGDKSEGEGGN